MNNTKYFNLIGTGRLGMNLLTALVQRTEWHLKGVCNRRLSRSTEIAQLFGGSLAVASLVDLPPASVTFIVAPDDSLIEVVDALAINPSLQPGDIVVHCSGVYSSDILYPLKQRGCEVGSMHPFKAFRSSNFSADAFEACDCVIEGDEKSKTFLSILFGQLGAKVISLSTDKKPLYHAAATMASNYLVTLASNATSLLLDAGINAHQAKKMIERLMEGSLQNIKESDNVAEALTGPLMRGDLNTLLLHLSNIKSPHTEALYRVAGLATLPLTHHSDTQLMALQSLLTQ